MNHTIEPINQSKVIIEPDYRTVATEGPEGEHGGEAARQGYHTLPEHRSEVENLTQEQPEAEKELAKSQALSSVNRLEAGGAETESHEHLQPVKPAETQESNANSLKSSRTLKPKRSDTVHLTSSDVVKERSTKRKSFTNILGMGERKNSNPVIGSGGLSALPKSQYANSTRTGRKDEGKSETARSLAKSQGLENGQEGGASHNSQENIEGSNNNSQKNLEADSPSFQENQTSEKL